MNVAGGAPPIAELQRVLQAACGLTLTAGVSRTLGDAFQRAARDSGSPSEAFLARLRAGDEGSLAALVEAAVIGETYFFRHPEQLAALEALLFRPAPRERPLSIWSAGCATGEEPYTLAMALLDAGRAGAGDRILATDVSARALAAARAARYGEWSLRRLDPVLRARHFGGTLPDLFVRAEARALVRFQRHNLVKEPPPASDLDLVVCRNVLIYFSAETGRAVVESLFRALRPGGLLLLGPVEAPLAGALPGERLQMNGALVHRRPEDRTSRRPARAARRAGGARLAIGPKAPAPARRPAPKPADSTRTAPAAAAAPGDGFEAACAAARRGDLEGAERIARGAAARDLLPEAWLLVSMAADARGDLEGAVDAARRALYLEPGLALGHAALVPLYGRLGRDEDAARARRNALDAIAGLDDAAPLRGVETITAGALRSALHPAGRSGRGVFAPSGGVA